ncbi:hypothetical protein [Natrialbaceae archaeon AArc-T1-2]|uniref:hypothetical protein n=1 Tax=Natrialbaceae archaeon AArc-T1-2 TaxID=3053904 RepID=UPI00255B24DB|nr:hypothetical protein [Natrialbaceae archaeon AArc-T1-2]WIV66378.1 hypothetical protein QQ977_11845 [Natrialbaceae archaeon AArc-T1-2]
MDTCRLQTFRRTLSVVMTTDDHSSDIPTAAHYSAPDELAALYESDADELRRLFRREDRTNGRTVRLESVSSERVELSTTAYYRSFLTNFCPGYELSGGTTLRALSEPLLFDGETASSRRSDQSRRDATSSGSPDV